MKRPNLRVIEPAFPTTICAVGLGTLDTLALALFDEAPLHLGIASLGGRQEQVSVRAAGDKGREAKLGELRMKDDVTGFVRLLRPSIRGDMDDPNIPFLPDVLLPKLSDLTDPGAGDP